MKKVLSIDFETYSTVDIAKCGSYKYMEDPEFEILLMAYAYDDADVVVLDFTAGDPIPAQVLKDLTDPGVTKTAFNCAFEREALRQHLGVYMPPEQWEDTMILAGQCGLPMNLAGASKALNLSEDEAKMKEGKALIQYFCKPCKPTKTNGGRTRNLPEHAPEKWTTFKRYNGMDVVAERAIRKRLIQWKPLPEEHAFWCLDAKINERGVRIDRQLAFNAVAMDEKYKAELTERAIAITGLDNPKSVSQVKNWLADQEGKSFPSLNKKVIADVVSELETDEAKEFMAIRSELSKSSTAKYAAMLRSMCKDDHVRGCFAFYGANRTGRFAGRLVQFQNMSKNEMPDIATCRDAVKNGHYRLVKCLYDGVARPLSELVRTSIIPEDGHQLLVADFSAIEARVIAWMAGEQWRLDVFQNGGDIYCASASQMFKVPVVKHGENGHLRQKGKVAELALGYGGGINALKAFGADKMGMTEEEMQETVDLWRESSPKITAMWRKVEKAAIRAIVKRGTVVLPEYKGLSFTYESGVLWMTLPSGRRLAYWDARYAESGKAKGRKTLSYMGVDQRTKKWSRIETWGGKLVENCWAGGTLVLTSSGFKPIAEVTTDDYLWDGFEWVEHDGCVNRGSKEVVRLSGTLVTPDHKILTREGWRHAKDCDGLHGAPVQLFGRFRERNQQINNVLPRVTLSAGRLSVSETGRKEPVYDLINAGPRHQYIVMTSSGPIISHNCVQATARDCLRESMFALDKAGYDIRAHVHDEVIVTEPMDGRSVEQMADLMGQDISWAPGLPLRADGYSTPFYIKD